MELFYSKNISLGATSLDSDESNHCIKVLRHHRGDIIHVIDGKSMLFECTIIDDNPREVVFSINKAIEGYGTHPYRLHMAVAPPKNIDRFEWFAEKATEIGLDEITPVFGDYSERKIFKPERIERLLISAAKQSHKSTVPQLNPAVSVMEFIKSTVDSKSMKLICYCDEVQSLGATKTDIKEKLRQLSTGDEVLIMIGPEGDFSRNEISAAIASGWHVISLGTSRLRIETAALVATAAVYLNFSDNK